MSSNFKKKEQIVSKISKILESAVSVVIASLEGSTVNEITNLRLICRKNNIYVCVVRNTLMRRIFKKTIFNGLQSLCIGSNIIAFSMVEINDCAKIFVKFSKANSNFKLKGAMFNGVFFNESDIIFLSALPSYKDCILNLLRIMNIISAGRLINALRIIVSSYKKN